MARYTYTNGETLDAPGLNTRFVQASPASSRTIHPGSWSGTTDASSNLVVTHGAGFTPTQVLVTLATPSGGGNTGYAIVTAITATTFTLRLMAVTGSTASLATTGYYLCIA